MPTVTEMMAEPAIIPIFHGLAGKLMRKYLSRYFLPVCALLLTSAILSMVQLKADRPIILAERFVPGLGWIEILVISAYAAFITDKMRYPENSAKWRRFTWTLFTLVFFGQLVAGLLGEEKFLMTGKLHLPVPLMILSGPVFRGHISFMPVLFLSTLIISGPAWCSQLCYFGALDNLAAGTRTRQKPLRNKFRMKHLMLLGIISLTLMLRFLDVSTRWTTILAGGFGVTGLGIIAFLSRSRGKMVHCILWCPIGTIVNYLKFVSLFRMDINESCTDCMACTRHCNYDALNKADILNRKPGLTCTLCGDCIAACKTRSIRYRFLSLSPAVARNTWIVLTISLHAVFMALARI